MKTWQFITIIVLVLGSIGLSTFSLYSLSNRIEQLESKVKITEKNSNSYNFDNKELEKQIYNIAEDSHFCRLGIIAHRDERRSWTEDFTKLFLNTFK